MSGGGGGVGGVGVGGGGRVVGKGEWHRNYQAISPFFPYYTTPILPRYAVASMQSSTIINEIFVYTSI